MNVVRFIGKITGGGSSTAGIPSHIKPKLKGKSGYGQFSTATVVSASGTICTVKFYYL